MNVHRQRGQHMPARHAHPDPFPLVGAALCSAMALSLGLAGCATTSPDRCPANLAAKPNKPKKNAVPSMAKVAVQRPSQQLTQPHPRPRRCALWDPTQHSGLFGWSAITDQVAARVFHAKSPDEVEHSFPTGYRFHAVSPNGVVWLTRIGSASHSVSTMEGGHTHRTYLFLQGQIGLPRTPVLFVPSICTQRDAALRRLPAEPHESIRAALQKAGRELGFKPTPNATRVARANLGKGAKFVVNHFDDGGYYPSSAAFTMNSDGRIVDVIMIGEAPTHSKSIPYATDLDGDGIEELVHLVIEWEGIDAVNLIGWPEGQLKSVFLDHRTTVSAG